MPHACTQTETIGAIQRELRLVTAKLPHFEALLHELGGIHHEQGESRERLTRIEDLLESTVSATRNLTSEVEQLAPLVSELSAWRGEGQTREIEALRAAMLEQARAQARQEQLEAARASIHETQAEVRTVVRERSKAWLGFVQAVVVAVIGAGAALGVAECGRRSHAAPVLVPAPAAH